MKALVLAAALLTGCAPTYYQVTKRCPTTTMLLGDFFLTAAGLTVSTIKWNADKEWQSVAWSTGAMALALGANMAEIRGCKR